MRLISFRQARYDELGLRRALSDRMMPFLVSAMAFLAALAISGWMGAAVLTRHWQSGAGAILTVQLPNPTQPSAAGAETRLVAVQALLAAAPGVDSADTLSDDQLNTLLRPWLGTDIKNLAIPVPAVIAVHMAPDTKDLTPLAAQLAKAAPGTIVEDQAAWAGRLGTLARSLQACAGLVLLIVTVVTAAVISVATRSGLAFRREAILIVYQLGATDSYIARRFATRAAALAYLGGLIGGVLALPVMFLLAALAEPLAAAPSSGVTTDLLPPLLWFLPIILPGATAVIGYLTTQITMRRWLRRLP
jgi:cell division transport system permease protein